MDRVKFRRDSDEEVCGERVPGEGSRYAKYGGIACMRRYLHAGEHVGMCRDAAIADGVCGWCRRPLTESCRTDCDRPVDITDFRGPHRWLSNYHLVEIDYEGIKYPSTEHAYMATKTLDLELRRECAAIPEPREARQWGQRVPLRPDWEDIKLRVMEDVLRVKFRHPELRRMLLDTWPGELVEGNTWGDVFWGVCDGWGENHLGKLLMEIRADELIVDERVGPTEKSWWGGVICSIRNWWRETRFGKFLTKVQSGRDRSVRRD